MFKMGQTSTKQQDHTVQPMQKGTAATPVAEMCHFSIKIHGDDAHELLRITCSRGDIVVTGSLGTCVWGATDNDVLAKYICNRMRQQQCTKLVLCNNYMIPEEVLSTDFDEMITHIASHLSFLKSIVYVRPERGGPAA